MYNLKCFDLDLIDAEGFDNKVLNPMFEEAKKQFKTEADEIMTKYNEGYLLKYEAYSQLKELLNKIVYY